MLIQETADLIAVCERARAHGRLALDTEFHNEDTYYARLALLQIGIDDRRPGEPLEDDDILLIDPQARGLDLSPLADLLLDPGVEVVLHASENDLIIVERFKGRPATRVFDTQVAAAMLGMGSQIGYAKLIEKACRVSLEKQESFSNWLARPLRDAQLAYARDDVRHLLLARDWLAQRVDERGRRAWLDEELQYLEDPSRYHRDPSEAWRRVPGSRDLDPASHLTLQALAGWREERARSRDIPRQRILGDKTLLEFARRRPATRGALLATRGLRRSFREIDEVLALIQRAIREASELAPRPRKRGRSGPPRADRHVVALVSAVLSALSHKADIETSLLANRRETEALVCWYGEPEFDASEVRLLNGWRADLIGNDVLAFLEGRVSVQLDAQTGQPRFVDLASSTAQGASQ
jgi:ribonuclease D